MSNRATTNLREVKRARGGKAWSIRGGRGFESVGRSGGNARGKVLRFVKEDVLDKEQYS